MDPQTLLIDAHVHLYPQHDTEQFIKSGLKNMQKIANKHKLAGNSINVWLLTEGESYNAFDQLLALQSGQYSVERVHSKCIQVADPTNNPLLYIFSGRQIVSTDKLEVCALLTNHTYHDRQYNTADTIKMVADAGAVPALNWAPGKWLFKRGEIVQNTLNAFNPADLLISETTMRPTVWPTPVLVKEARAKGFRMLAGSDPLPFNGEEKLAGSYVSCIKGVFETGKPVESLHSLLTQQDVPITLLGRRSGPFVFTQRQLKIMNYNRNKS